MNCSNCKQHVVANYCSNCGQPAVLKRIDWHYIQHEVEHVLHFDKGILYTIKELLINPGKNIRDFISCNRSRLVKPVIFIIVSSLIYTVTIHFFHIEDHYFSYSATKQTAVFTIFKWLQSHYGYANIILGVFIALWLKLFFKKSNYNVFEILILLCFVLGMGMLFYSIFAVLEGLTKFPLMGISSMILIFYCTWAIGQFFDQKRISSYPKALIAYLLGMLTFVLFAILTGFLCDLIIY